MEPPLRGPFLAVDLGVRGRKCTDFVWYDARRHLDFSHV